MIEPPCQTIYLKNLTEKLSKEKLRRQLFNLASRFGPVLDIIVHCGQSMRGQAWIVFSSVDSAVKAISKLDGYVFFEKPIQVQFAKAEADVVAKLAGTFVARSSSSKKRETTAVKSNKEVSQPAKRTRVDDASFGGGHDSNKPPCPILKVDAIPEGVTKATLEELFSKFEGFREVRFVSGKQIAFIEYFSTDQAKSAREGIKLAIKS